MVARLAAKYARGPKFLDLGCGSGKISVLFQHLMPDAQISIADAYPTCLDMTEAKLGGVSARYLIGESDFNIRQVIDDTFDVIVLSHVLEHLLNPVQAMRDCMSLLNPGGILVVAVPNAARPIVVLFGNIFRRHYVNRGHVVSWDPSHFKNFLERILQLNVVEYASDKIDAVPGRAGVLMAKLLPWWGFSIIAAVRK